MTIGELKEIAEKSNRGDNTEIRFYASDEGDVELIYSHADLRQPPIPNADFITMVFE